MRLYISYYSENKYFITYEKDFANSTQEEKRIKPNWMFDDIRDSLLTAQKCYYDKHVDSLNILENIRRKGF